jgi:hypothetical protein
MLITMAKQTAAVVVVKGAAVFFKNLCRIITPGTNKSSLKKSIKPTKSFMKRRSPLISSPHRTQV